MRVSDAARYTLVTRNVAMNQKQMLQAARQASSGRRVGLPSDDPVAAAHAARLRANLDQTVAFRASINILRTDLQLAESNLASATDILGRVRQIALAAANGSASAEDRAAMAREVEQLRDQLLQTANAQGSNGFLFAGSQPGVQPYDAAGVYGSDSKDRQVEIAQGVVASVTMPGASVFTVTGGRDVFADIAAFKDALDTNDATAISSSLGSLEAGTKQVLRARTAAGTKIARLDSADAVHAETESSITIQHSKLTEADPAASYSRLAVVQQSLDAALAVARMTLSTLRNPLG